MTDNQRKIIKSKNLFIFFVLFLIVFSLLILPFQKNVTAVHDNFWENFIKYENNPISNYTEGFWGDQSTPGATSNGHLHPDVLYFPNGLQGYKYWCYYTPYPPNGAEDLCLARTNNLTNWSGCFRESDNPITNGGDFVGPGTSNWTNGGPPTNSANGYNADCDVLHIPEYNKFFILLNANPSAIQYDGHIVLLLSDGTYGGVNDTGHDDGNPDPYCVYYYNGSPVSDKGNPVMFANGEASSPVWETQSNEASAVFDRVNETFIIFYSANVTDGGNGEHGIGKITMQWNNSNQSMYNRTRHGIKYYPNDKNGFQRGVGHIDVGIYNNSLYMIGIRTPSGAGQDYDLDLARSDDWGDTWTREYNVLNKSDSDWDDNYIYRSCFIHDGYGNIDHPGNKMWIMYTAHDDSQRRLGLAYVNLTWYTQSDAVSFLSINNNTNGTKIYTSTVVINWTVVEGASQYHLEVDNNSDFSSPEFNYTDINIWNYPTYVNVNTTRVSFELPDKISICDKYYCRVRAYVR